MRNFANALFQSYASQIVSPMMTVWKVINVYRTGSAKKIVRMIMIVPNHNIVIGRLKFSEIYKLLGLKRAA